MTLIVTLTARRPPEGVGGMSNPSELPPDEQQETHRDAEPASSPKSEASEADMAEQDAPIDEEELEAEEEEQAEPAPLEADPFDTTEQRRVVELDDDQYS